MKNLEAIRKMDNFEKRLADLTEEFNKFKESTESGKRKSLKKLIKSKK